MKRYLILTSIVLLLLIGYYFFFLRNASENKLIDEGNSLVKKIELYKKHEGKLPSSLTVIGVKELDTGPLFYQIEPDSLNYIIWFGSSLGESKTYHSDSKKWEDYDR